MPNALVLVMDRLGCGYLGPYGNTWIETPAWNRLAAQSLLAESSLIDSPDLDTLYRSYWHAAHAMSAPSCPGTPPLADLLADDAVATWLITDEPVVADHAASRGFDHRLILPPAARQEAESVEQTQLARVFATAIDVLERAEPPYLIWVHAQAMEGPWDAPYSFRAQFAEGEDPDPPRFVEPPERMLADDFDPDDLLGIAHAYAGQVVLLDTCLGVLLNALASPASADSTALLATSARGFPLGEHRYVGRRDHHLFAELLHVPWMMRWPSGEGATQRTFQLVQPPDLYPTLLDWFGTPRPEPPLWGSSLTPLVREHDGDLDRNQACAVHGDQRVVRVPAWSLRQGPGGERDLFVKPDDRWEINEISDRCPRIADELAEVLASFEAATRRGDRRLLLDLPSSVLDVLE